MIHHLLQAITDALKLDLKKEIPEDDNHWGVTPITDPTSITLPYLTLYLSKLQVDHPLQQLSHSSTQPDPPAPLTITQEFQQDFVIELYDKTPSDLEKRASLVIGGLLTNHDSLIKRYNTTDIQANYQTNQISTRHHLRQFQFHAGIPTYASNVLGLQLNFTAIGHLSMSRSMPDSQDIIQTINISTK
ncbi:hypothetical protein D0962_04710 [Leptolyngbyaceae cyanobacterium CCMR0082]|uniref:Uncharacterized protein n=1 Tax=Adonisia turfae CCMR0082 TaxID=2304604 RepID=A0A6M0S288_9CYAN|nr:hypothetical protein [Adonisia turfae]NEZ62081.1 hypothetical protein [Adonisia turfae CCMR0082]